MPVVDVNHLYKAYGGQNALADITFSLQPGERLVVAGEAGAGKTLLCRLLMGMLAPTSGSVRLFGHDALLGGRICRQRTGYLPAEASMDPQLDAAAHMRRVLSFYPRASHGRAQSLLKDLAIPPDILVQDMTPALSRRLSLALALAAQPELLILDEPFAPYPQDEPEESALLARVIEEARGERTALIVTAKHVDTPPLPLSRALLLRGGQVIADGLLERLRFPCRRVTVRGRQPDAALIDRLRAWGVRRQGEQTVFFYDGAIDALLGALLSLHPQDVAIENACADDVLALSQAEGEMA